MFSSTLHVLRCSSGGSIRQAIPSLASTRQTIRSNLDVRRCLPSNHSRTVSSYTAIHRGALNTTDYRIFFENDGNIISPLHDIPLYANDADKTFHMVCEVPRWTNAKMEISLKDTLNPIKQDTKKGKLRYVANCFPHHGYIWNYGALPQTWENPKVTDKATGYKGDNDPIDALEIGYKVAKIGDVLKVKVLGVLAFIDEGETDWKIIVIDVNDPLADRMNNVADIDKHFPGLLKMTIDWFKFYKIPDGKPENQFAFNGEVQSRDFALQVIDEVHKHWKNLVNKKVDAGGIVCSNATIEGSPFRITRSTANELLKAAPEPKEPEVVDSSIDRWYYDHLK